MEFKRITIISGHYGSGKTNIAVNLVVDLKKQQNKVAICDIDIVNPYFRTKDSEELFNQKGIRLICSAYANSNVDIPALPQDMYAVTDDKELYSILDVGGDERGALALGRLAPMINQEDYDMFYVINKFRPLTRDVNSALEVMKEIEDACKIKFTGVINNSNLGLETTADDVISSMDFANEFCKMVDLPLVFTSVDQKIYENLKDKINNLYPLTMQKKL
ncbi:MAG: P-loop NTPase [Clostridia bacterium]|nr:P-loop NTPase [Clostridia bacterium]